MTFDADETLLVIGLAVHLGVLHAERDRLRALVAPLGEYFIVASDAERLRVVRAEDLFVLQ